MRVTLAVTAWMVSVVSSYSYPANDLPDINNEAFIKDCTRIHNKFRSEVKPAASDMLYMTWDPVLARVAEAWARKCQFKHNVQLSHPYALHPNFTAVGENIWSGSRSIFSVSSAIASWYDEIQYYDFKTRKCSKVCGHYTQVVWADSYKVGCAVQYCSGMSGLHFTNAAHFICNYGPAHLPSQWLLASENYEGCTLRVDVGHDTISEKDSVWLAVLTQARQSGASTVLEPDKSRGNYPTWPYKKGSTCSACRPDDKCLDNLCANSQRDRVTRYYSIVYPDWPLFSRNRYLSLFLIISPPILILSAIITILVKYKSLILRN